MARRCDEIQQNVYAIVSETRITLDPRLFGKDVIVLPLEVANNFREAFHDQYALVHCLGRSETYLASLSI